MDQKPEIELVYLAVSSLYHNPDPSEKERASQWLGNLQKSVFAWTTADELLRHKRDLESCYFAAQTMRTKIHQSFHELPLDAHISLRDSLLDHIGQITEGTNSVIITQLCLALADLALQMPSWQKVCLDLIGRCNQLHLWPLLEVLTVLPEELESRSVRLGENRRQEILEDFQLSSGTVNEFLQHCINNYTSSALHENVQVQVKILRCFTSWTSMGSFVLSDVVLDNAVIIRAFQILSYKQENASDKSASVPAAETMCDGAANDKSASVPGALHDAAADCVGVLLQSLEDNNNQQNLDAYLFNSVLNLEIPYHLSVANEESEKCMNYCRLFTELAESFLDKIITHSNQRKQPHFALKILDLVLNCVGHHDYEVAEITFNLWYMLSEDLYQKNTVQITDMFRPYVERLITALCRHCHMEPDHEGLLEDGDDFKDFRNKASDLVKDVVFIVGSATCFKHMFMNLQMPSATWDSSEAALFIMKAVAKNILPTESEVVPSVISAILSLPPTTSHIAVRHTSILLLGELCEWIEKNTPRQNCLDPVLNYLVSCLGHGQGVGSAAATALQSICTTCNHHMGHHMPILIELVRQVDGFGIGNPAIIGLLKGIAAIITCMPHDEITAALREICMLQSEPLLELMDKNVPPAWDTKTDPIVWLDRLSAIFRFVVVSVPDTSPTHPCQPIVVQLYPVISRCVSHYGQHSRAMEHTCRTLRYMFRSVPRRLPNLLEPLAAQLVQTYAHHQHSCFLYLGGVLVDEYATDNGECTGGLLQMLEQFIQPAFGRLLGENGLKENPDTVDDFFRLCTRLLQRAPLAFLGCTAIPHIIECGLMACALDHKEANTTVMKFFSDLVNTGRSGKHQPDFFQRQELIKQVLVQYGPRLMGALLQACVFYLHTYMLGEVGDVIAELLSYNREQTGKWLADMLATLPKQHNGVVSVTELQLKDFLSSVMASDSSKSVTYALKDLARLYR